MNRRSDKSWLIPLLLAAGAAAAVAYYWLSLEGPAPVPAVREPEPAASGEHPKPGPIHPLEPLAGSDDSDRRLVELPPLSDSDAYLRLEAVDLFGRTLDPLLSNQSIVEKFVATVDNLPRRHVAERLRPVGRISGTFQANAEKDDTFVIGTDNAKRYTPLVDMFVAANLDGIVDAYRRFYPLFQQAYVELGYPDGYFNDRVVEVIDHLLATPAAAEPIALVRPNVLYEFADPELEALSAGQKLMLRIGAENRERVLTRLREFRARIATHDDL